MYLMLVYAMWYYSWKAFLGYPALTVQSSLYKSKEIILIWVTIN